MATYLVCWMDLKGGGAGRDAKIDPYQDNLKNKFYCEKKQKIGTVAKRLCRVDKFLF